MNPSSSVSPHPSLDVVVRMLGAAKLPTEDLMPAHCEHFFFLGDASAPGGLVGVELFGDVALLRSLAVAEERRGRGEGSALLHHAERYARARGVRAIYLLTTTAEEFFMRHGYAHVPRESAPAAIRSTREFASICPASSAVMTRQL